jgi:acyl-CoA reductase-like NAD-dependent aldehyde dehydrogenase
MSWKCARAACSSGGYWLDWDGPRFDQVHPSNNQVMTSFPEAGERGVDAAVAAARTAFDDGPWPRLPARDRKRILQPIIERIYAQEIELAQLQTLDNGIAIQSSILYHVLSVKSTASPRQPDGGGPCAPMNRSARPQPT